MQLSSLINIGSYVKEVTLHLSHLDRLTDVQVVQKQTDGEWQNNNETLTLSWQGVQNLAHRQVSQTAPEKVVIWNNTIT